MNPGLCRWQVRDRELANSEMISTATGHIQV